MKEYSLEEVYLLVGRDDRTTGVHIKIGTEAYTHFGSYIVMIATYSQSERLMLTGNLENNITTSGYIKGKYLMLDIPDEKQKLLESHGILNTDIWKIDYIVGEKPNSFHSNQTRKANKILIPFDSMPDGKDFFWMWGFYKQLVQDGEGISPVERVFHLAGKLIINQSGLTAEEKQEVFIGNDIVEPVEFQYLSIKFQLGTITNEEKRRLSTLLLKRQKECLAILEDQLQKSGSSIKILLRTEEDKAIELLYKTIHYHERRLNVSGKKAIYMSLKDYLHIYLRHVNDYRVSHLFDKKDKFQWQKDDVEYVIKNVVEKINDNVQEHFKNNPEARYGLKNEDAVYFEGDYYAIFIEKSGRVTTLYKVNKPESI